MRFINPLGIININLLKSLSSINACGSFNKLCEQLLIHPEFVRKISKVDGSHDSDQFMHIQ
jgi:hypothetical protein